VDFRFEAADRTNPIRESLLSFAFDKPPAAAAASRSLAQQLGQAMDRRSAPCLFVAAAGQQGPHRQVTLWTFPREDAFRFDTSHATPTIDLLADVFSQTSHLRKAAVFEGRRLRNEFLSGRVLDFQANQVSRDIADFWIMRFLQCQLALQDEAGTRLLARTLRKAYDTCPQIEEKEQLYSAIVAIRSSPTKRWSLTRIANNYLQDAAKEAFLAAAPNDETRASQFEFDRTLFDEVMQFRVFHLENDIYVSSPFSQVGAAVTIAETPTAPRYLTCRGKILDEKVRSRHA
jgi:hypothetical protein